MIYLGFDGRYWVEMSDSFVEKLNFQAVIKSAASTASLDLQGSQRTTDRLAGDGHG